MSILIRLEAFKETFSFPIKYFFSKELYLQFFLLLALLAIVAFLLDLPGIELIIYTQK